MQLKNYNKGPANKNQDKSPKVFQREKVKEFFDIKDLDWTPKQREFIDLALNKETKILLINGPAGSSKSILSVYCGLKLLNDKRISDVLYLRSAVESSDKALGYLPGTIDDKLHFYNLPFIDKLEELLSKGDINKLQKDNRVSMFPVNFCRGMSWNAKCLILDECIVGEHGIVTDAGMKSIRSLYKIFQSGGQLPLIKTFNETTSLFDFKPLKRIWSNGEKEIISLVCGNRLIKCTDNHKFLTSRGWIMAKEIKSGEAIIANDFDALQTLKVLNDDQFQIVLGSFLGDGSMHRIGVGRWRLKVLHGIKQADYCEWKASLFHAKTNFIEKNGYAQTPAIKFTTKGFNLNEGFLNEGPKTNCNRSLVDSIDLRALAIWYMDDGNLNITDNGITLSTCSFDENTQKLLVKKLSDLGYPCRYKNYYHKSHNKNYYSIYLGAESTRKFLKDISPYMHNNLSYKSIYPVGGYNWDNQFKAFNHIVCDRIKRNNEKAEVFDLEVEDNHNFIVGMINPGNRKNESMGGIVAHNCQNSTLKEIITVLTRLGKFSKCFVLADPSQTDLTNGKRGAFESIFSLLSDEESKQNGIHTFTFGQEDIMRSDLVRFLSEKFKKLIVV